MTTEESLRAGLGWLLDEYLSRVSVTYNVDDEPEETPPHQCGYYLDPESGYCEFHDRFWDVWYLMHPEEEAS